MRTIAKIGAGKRIELPRSYFHARKTTGARELGDKRENNNINLGICHFISKSSGISGWGSGEYLQFSQNWAREVSDPPWPRNLLALNDKPVDVKLTPIDSDVGVGTNIQRRVDSLQQRKEEEGEENLYKRQ